MTRLIAEASFVPTTLLAFRSHHDESVFYRLVDEVRLLDSGKPEFDAAKGIATVEYAKSMGAEPPLSDRLRVANTVDFVSVLVQATPPGQYLATGFRAVSKTALR